MNGKPLLVKVNILPFKPQNFAGTPQTAKTSQSEDQPPLCIGACLKDFLGNLRRDKEESGFIGPNRYRLASKRILADNLRIDRRIKELPCNTDMPPERIFRKPAIGLQMYPKAFCQLNGNIPDVIPPKETVQFALDIFPFSPGGFLNIG